MRERLFGRQTSRRGPTAEELSPEEIREEVAAVEHWYHHIEVAPGVVTPGVHDSPAGLRFLKLPENLEGKRVLDVGARDGFFSFEAEKRGAEVLAIEAVAREHLKGFDTAASLLGSRVEMRTINVYDLSPEEVGTFDVILFLGVLYHLRDPMLALDRLWGVAKPGALVWVESHTIDRGFVDPRTDALGALADVAPALVDVPIAQFYPRRMLGNPSNWWGPNLAGLRAMVEAAGFGVERSEILGSRGLVVARRAEDPEAGFWREFDRARETGEEGMAWESVGEWGAPQEGPKTILERKPAGADPLEAYSPSRTEAWLG
jgi:tRNA (mo5U34)-methyltransferase